MGYLEIFLNPLFEQLNLLNINYAIIGNYSQLPKYTPHDIDIWCENITKFDKILKEISARTNFKVYIKNTTPTGINYMLFYKTEGLPFIVHLDVMRETSYHHLIPLVESKYIKGNSKKYKNFFVVNENIEAIMHLLYPLFILKTIKNKYKDSIFEYRNDAFFYKILKNLLGKKKSNEIIKLIENKEWGKIINNIPIYKRQLVLRFIIKKSIFRFYKVLQYIYYSIKKIIYPNGLFIALIGPDGVGKTAIINEINKVSKDFFLNTKTRLFYWRPFLFPELKKIFKLNNKNNVEKVNEDGLNILENNFKKKLFYHMKFFYYLVDFIIGRVKFLKEYSTGGLILFDRYYFDNMIYPGRFGFIVNYYVQKFFFNMIAKPDILFYLDCPPRVILTRKKELSKEEILRQQKEYEKISMLQINFIKINTNRTLQNTVSEILSICLDYMSHRVNK